jgi:aminodeoxyfutalosine synthase
MVAQGMDARVTGHGTTLVTLDEARAWWDATDLVGVGMAADAARRKRHGDTVTYVRVAEVAVDAARDAAWPDAAGEIRLAGAPSSRVDAAATVRAVVARAGGTPVTAFSLHELERATGGGAALVDYVRALADAGVAGLAEVRLDALGDARRAIDALAAAAVPAMRFTLDRLPGDVPATLHDVRLLQEATGLVRVFSPLPREIDPSTPTTGYQDVKAVALARLVLDNVSSIQVDWARYGPKLAQVALLFGADDIDGVSPADDAAGGRRRAPREEIRRNVEAAGLRAVERDARFAVRA